jgi:hypothetical protein
MTKHRTFLPSDAISVTRPCDRCAVTRNDFAQSAGCAERDIDNSNKYAEYMLATRSMNDTVNNPVPLSSPDLLRQDKQVVEFALAPGRHAHGYSPWARTLDAYSRCQGSLGKTSATFGIDNPGVPS